MFWTPSRLLSGGRVPPLDADDACMLLAALATSVGVRCRIVGARYGRAWTCWVAYAVGDRWDIIDPLCQRPGREPDEVLWGPMPDGMSEVTP